MGFFGWLKCKIGLHYGHSELIEGGPIMFYCVRCETYMSPSYPDGMRLELDGLELDHLDEKKD